MGALTGRLGLLALIAALVCLPGASGNAGTFVSDTYAGSGLGHFDYHGRWEHVRNLDDGRFFGTSSRTAVSGAYVTLTFVGRVVRLYGTLGPGGGHGVVFLDGVRYAAIDFNAPQKMARYLVFSSPLLELGTHSITIAAVGEQRRPKHRSSYINLSGAAYE